jgi:hypothetical protein
MTNDDSQGECRFCEDTGHIRVYDFDGSHAEPCPFCLTHAEHEAKRAALARSFGTDAERRRIRTWATSNSVPMRAPR